MIVECLIILGLILVNGLLAGAEIAIVTLRKGRLRELVEQGSGSAAAAERLRDNPERFLATVQVGITVLGSAAAVFGGSSIAAELVPLLQTVPFLAEEADELALAAVVVLVSFLSLILGELVPKSLALRSGERYALLVSRPLVWLSWVSRPVVWFLTATSNLVLKLFGDRTNFTEARLSMEELRGLVDDATRQGTVDPEAGEIASRALDFGDLTAVDVMVHRRFVVALPVNAGEDELRRVLLEVGHRRVPVYGESRDHVLGYVLWSDVVERVWARQPVSLRELVREGYFVPETTAASALLDEMQRRRNHLAIVVDEHGGMAGIVTLEDLLEELVGEIASERDPQVADWTKPDADGWYHLAGNLAIRDVNRETELDLPEPDEWTSVGGLAIHAADGRIPAAGETFDLGDDQTMQIHESSGRRVRAVRVKRAKVRTARRAR